MDAAFRKGEGDYIHQQGPAPQQLEHDKVGHVVASVGEAIGPCAFSSLAATRQWLATDAATRFTRAYRKARAWLLATPAARWRRRKPPSSRDRPRRAHRDHRLLPEARLLDAARGDHPPRLRGALDVFQHAG
jgi:NitT/TauT family transport system substrate-binding protein